MNSLIAALVVGLFCAVGAGAQTPAVTGSSDPSLAAGTAINAELNSSIDSKKAKPGAQITAHITEAVKSADGRTILPNGTKLIGHVTQASVRSHGQDQALLAFQFDKAMLKGGQEMPLTNALAQAVAAPSREASAFGADAGPTTTTAGAGAPTNNPGMSGNPSMSDSRGARPESTPATQPYPGTDPNAAGGGDSNFAGPLSANTRGVYGLQGVRLNANENGAVLTSSAKNVHLDGGTRLLLTVQPQSATAAPSSR